MVNKPKVNLAQRIARSIRERNVYETLANSAAFFEDVYFDWKHNVNTIERFEIRKCDTIGTNAAFGVSYSPTRVRALRNCLQALNLPRGGSLVDLGAGKGRVLLVASEFGFKKIIGVEFSNYLSDIARDNINRYKAQSNNLADIKMIHADVVDFVWNDDESVIFMFHSFGEPVLNKVISNIVCSWVRNPRSLWLIYHNPVHKDSIEKNNKFEFFRELRFCGNDFYVYRINAL